MMPEKMVEFELLFRSSDGSLGGAYLKLRDGKVDHTKEIEQDVLLADYDKAGRLLGIDVLAAVDLSIMIELVDDPTQRAAIENIMKNRVGDLLSAA